MATIPADALVAPSAFMARLDEMRAASATRKQTIDSLQAELAAKEADVATTRRLLALAQSQRSRTAALIVLCDVENERISRSVHTAEAASTRLVQQEASLLQRAKEHTTFVAACGSQTGDDEARQLVGLGWLAQPRVQRDVATIREMLDEFQRQWPAARDCAKGIADAPPAGLPPTALSADQNALASWIVANV